MADGALKLNLNHISAARLESHAVAIGVSPEALAVEMLDRLLDDPLGLQAPASRPEDFDGPYVDLDEAIDEFSAELERRLASRAG